MIPAVLWLAYFATLALFDEVGWSVELWAGVTVMSAFAGIGLALLLLPPASPASPEVARSESLERNQVSAAPGSAARPR